MGESLTTSIQEQIDFFFTPPFPRQSGGRVSTLRLVRQEVQDCLIGDVIPEDQVLSDPRKRHRLCATTMVIMAGVDLLAKFYAGSDDNRGSGERIQKFLTTFMFRDERARREEYAQVLYYGCRNPLFHSFTLHQTRFSIVLSDSPATGVVFPHPLDPGIPGSVLRACITPSDLERVPNGAPRRVSLAVEFHAHVPRIWQRRNPGLD